MKTADLISAVVMFVLSGVVFLTTRDLPYWADFAPGSGFAPLWVAMTGAVLAVALLVGALRRQDNPPADWPDRTGWRRVLLTTIGLWAVIVLAPILGMISTAVIFMLFLLLAVERRRLWPSLFTTAVTTALVYGVFAAWLGIAFPKGVIGI